MFKIVIIPGVDRPKKRIKPNETEWPKSESNPRSTKKIFKSKQWLTRVKLDQKYPILCKKSPKKIVHALKFD